MSWRVQGAEKSLGELVSVGPEELPEVAHFAVTD
jgi:hypothetical protein